MRVDVNLCTFRRPDVALTLKSLDKVAVPEGVSLRIVVIDNDTTASAQALIEDVAQKMRFPVHYIHAPACNISIARNAALAFSDSDWIAFLDDDEWVNADWLSLLIARQKETDADAVFGHSIAQYGKDAPRWIVEGDYHSNFAKYRDGEVQTGYTCNALLRWNNTPWFKERFDIARGQSGGEDTEFFFRLRRMGAKYAICDDARAYETVSPDRLTFTWLRQRRVRMGQSYSSRAMTPMARVVLFASATVKSAYCHFRAIWNPFRLDSRNYWLLRGALHLGVCAGCLMLPTRKLYGGE